MIERGDYISPTFNYEPRFNKPVLSYWIVAAFYQAVRRLGRRAAAADRARRRRADRRRRSCSPGSRSPAPPGAARRASRPRCGPPSAWPSSPRLLMFARRIFIDIYISLFMALTLLCFARGGALPGAAAAVPRADVRVRRPRRADQGPGRGGRCPALVFAVYLLLHRELKRVTAMMLPAGVAIVLAIVVPWYAALYRRDGWTLHRVVLRRREHRAVHVGPRRAGRARAVLLPAGRLQRFVPVGAVPVPAAIVWWRERRGADAAGPGGAGAHAALAVDPGDRRLLLAVRRQAGPLHLSDRPGGGGAGRLRARARRRRRRRRPLRGSVAGTTAAIGGILLAHRRRTDLPVPRGRRDLRHRRRGGGRRHRRAGRSGRPSGWRRGSRCSRRRRPSPPASSR